MNPPPPGGGTTPEAGRGAAYALPEPPPETKADLQTGMKALVAVARHHGLDWSLQRLLHVYGAEGEPDAKRLSSIARDEGMKSATHCTDWSGLARFRSAAPFLARLSNGAYVVVPQTPAVAPAGTPAAGQESVVV